MIDRVVEGLANDTGTDCGSKIRLPRLPYSPKSLAAQSLCAGPKPTNVQRPSLSVTPMEVDSNPRPMDTSKKKRVVKKLKVPFPCFSSSLDPNSFFREQGTHSKRVCPRHRCAPITRLLRRSDAQRACTRSWQSGPGGCGRGQEAEGTDFFRNSYVDRAHARPAKVGMPDETQTTEWHAEVRSGGSEASAAGVACTTC